jgi:Transposase DDE domain group 1
VSQSATATISCFSPFGVPIDARFDGPQLTSDGGLVWLAEADGALGLCRALSARVPDWRTGPVRHSLETLLRQRIFQIACGYEDQDDADTLRSDPLLKLVCGRLPDGPDLASQPTLSRFENAVDFKACYRLARALLTVYLQERAQPASPTHILIDADSTDDPTYGDQEGSAYHGYYGQHMYHPLLLFDGETDQLITAVLRPGTAHASRGIVGILKRVVRAMQARWPGVRIEFRGDSGFAIPALYDYLEDQGMDYTIGLATNSRLEALAAPQLATATAQHAETGEKVRLLGEAQYAAGSWEHDRRVIIKTEVLAKGPNVRFVVTTRQDEPEALYTFYIQRGGGPELWIKDLKDACFADRLSDHTFWANQFRLLLHAAAYWLLDTIRRWLSSLHVARMQLDTLRLRLLKIGGWVRQRLDGIRLHLASSHPGELLWRLLAQRPHRLVNNPG